MNAITAFAVIGVAGVGAQWLAWRLALPGIVLMLVAGLVLGPFTGVLDPAAALGPLLAPMISVAVAMVLFEGGLTLNRTHLEDAARGVRRLVFVGAPLGWLLSVLALRTIAGLSWEVSAVFGGILIVTGPTVIAPLLRQARLTRRPAALLQWEAIVNDPIGALAAVLAFSAVLVLHDAGTVGAALLTLAIGIGFATALGLLGGWAIARAFRSAWVPEYMKVPILFVAVLAVFAASDLVLHESGLLAVTLMGLWLANADLPSYEELRRFKEHASVLLVSGVFILLAASFEPASLAALDWRAAAFVAAIIVVVRPLTVQLSLIGTGLPLGERWLVALTGPRGVVLMAVAGLFGQRLSDAGVSDGAVIGPLAFLLVAVSVVLHGFTLGPLAARLGLAGGAPGVLILGGNAFTLALAEALGRAEVPVMLTDPNHAHLSKARQAGIACWSGDILAEVAETRVELIRFQTLLTASDNDAHNTLVATDLGPEYGRDRVWQLRRPREESPRHALPVTLGGRTAAGGKGLAELLGLLAEGWRISTTRFTEEFAHATWAERNPEAVPLAVISKAGAFCFVAEEGPGTLGPGARLMALVAPEGRTEAEAKAS